MPDDPVSSQQPSAVPVQPSTSGPTPTGYVRQANGTFLWQPPTPEELQGQFAQYQVLELIGRGGMGAVYKAWQTNLDRNVAIKVLPRDLNEADPTFVERFKREAKTMASLTHPAIISVHDAGETPSGLLYFVMDFVEGTDVFQMLLEQGHIKTKHALLITAHVCDALQYAHNHGVMHRDIKPANIMVDSDGYVRVADFGLAKSLQSNAGLTQIDVSVGTPDYLAPEAFTVGMTSDHRADLYSVGVVLYQMLTGVIPRGNFKRPSELVPGVDQRFDAIVLRAMEPNPPQRYQSAVEIREALDEIITAPVIQSGGESSPAIPKKELSTTGRRRSAAEGNEEKKSPLVPILVGVVALVVVAAGVLFLMKVRGGNEVAKVAEVPPSTVVSKEAAARVPQSNEEKPPNEDPAAVAQPSAPKPPKDPLLALGPGSIPMPSSAEKQGEAKVAAKPEAVIALPSPPLAESTTNNNQTGQVPPKVETKTSTKPKAMTADTPPTPRSDTPKPSAPVPAPTERKNAEPQWQKVEWTQEDLNRFRSAPGITLQDGWWHLPVSGPTSLRFPLPKETGLCKNIAVRCRTRVPPGLKISRGSSSASHFLSISSGHARIAYYDQKAGSQFLSDAPLLAIEPNIETVAEFALIESRYFGRVGGLMLSPVKVDHAFGNDLAIMSLPDVDSWFKDVEYLILDGIPEAEALRILGVDEKGNDLRAMAAKQEQEQKEQAKQADTISALPELKQRHEQFLKLQAEKVTGPFEADVAKLNTGYLGALDRAIEDEKKAGRLEGVLAIQTEKQLVAAKEPLPEDDEKTPASLKKLRTVYRDSLAKSEAKKATNLKQIVEPLIVSLKQLQSDLTRQNRIQDATTVKEYREKLAQAPTAEQTGPTMPAPPKGLGITRRDPALAAATKEKPFENSLGMKFVPVKGTDVLFCIHETRWRDYAEYAKANPRVDGNWKYQTFEGIPLVERQQDHPVVKVNWEEAKSFCKWLSERENRIYRLPTDREWSTGVGLERKEKRRKGDTPSSLIDIPNEFPWGKRWPPPKGAGNYCDDSLEARAPDAGRRHIDGYDDGFPTTAPVMSFPPNDYGLHDMGGNVWEWVEDWWNDAEIEKVERGGGWAWGNAETVLSSHRYHFPPTDRSSNVGFRVVLDLSAPPEPSPASAPPKPAQKAQAPVATSTTSMVSQATKEKPFVNSLGMKFVPVKGTDVLFCIHETRWKDYAAYADANPGIATNWKEQKHRNVTINERPEEHPVVYVSWEEAQGLCKWLSEKEKRTYRLPTDREWSVAVGLGRKEKWRKGDLPSQVKGDPDEFPWGREWPPPKGAGNYSDQSRKARSVESAIPTYIDSYDDSFPTTAPVMSFAPNEFGLYDMGGNAREWVEDWWSPAKTDRVLRGASWGHATRNHLASTFRDLVTGGGSEFTGFRVVLEVSAGN